MKNQKRKRKQEKYHCDSTRYFDFISTPYDAAAREKNRLLFHAQFQMEKMCVIPFFLGCSSFSYLLRYGKRHMLFCWLLLLCPSSYPQPFTLTFLRPCVVVFSGLLSPPPPKTYYISFPPSALSCIVQGFLWL